MAARILPGHLDRSYDRTNGTKFDNRQNSPKRFSLTNFAQLCTKLGTIDAGPELSVTKRSMSRSRHHCDVTIELQFTQYFSLRLIDANLGSNERTRSYKFIDQLFVNFGLEMTSQSPFAQFYLFPHVSETSESRNMKL